MKNKIIKSETKTLRDEFAIKALSLFSLSDEDTTLIIEGYKPRHDIVADFCYNLADEMMKRRNK